MKERTRARVAEGKNTPNNVRQYLSDSPAFPDKPARLLIRCGLASFNKRKKKHGMR